MEDETDICGRDLLQTFSWSQRGLPAAQYTENQNFEQFSILPAISLTGILEMAVTQDTFNGCQWEDFLQADLVSKCEIFICIFICCSHTSDPTHEATSKSQPHLSM